MTIDTNDLWGLKAAWLNCRIAGELDAAKRD
jgi:hypothetical protein